VDIHPSARKHGIKDEDIGETLMPKSYGTSGGVEITDEVIERLAGEAEQGYDPRTLHPRGRPPLGGRPARVAQVRLPPELFAALDERAARDHVRPSEVIRKALREYLKL
jgi:CRISPR-associated endonuclease/helicase Cas3